MKVTFMDGAIFEADIAAPKGLQPPASDDDIVKKYQDLVRNILDPVRSSAIEDCVLKIDTVEDALEKLLGLLEGVVECPIDA